jgi:hypothetical protein
LTGRRPHAILSVPVSHGEDMADDPTDLPPVLRQLLLDQRRAAIANANALSRALGLPGVKVDDDRARDRTVNTTTR